jgi:hypothetical protein
MPILESCPESYARPVAFSLSLPLARWPTGCRGGVTPCSHSPRRSDRPGLTASLPLWGVRRSWLLWLLTAWFAAGGVWYVLLRTELLTLTVSLWLYRRHPAARAVAWGPL